MNKQVNVEFTLGELSDIFLALGHAIWLSERALKREEFVDEDSLKVLKDLQKKVNESYIQNDVF